jgi:EAL and modified HD-GYP domain-containing signal transduction protein
MADLYVGRQPIFNRKLKTYAYELLYRDLSGGTDDLSGEEATSRVINTLSEIGLEQIVGKHEAFINVTESLLHEDGLLGILPQQCVLEVKSSITPTPELISFLSKFSESGYRIALDDFEYREELKPLLDIADIIKMDVRALGQSGVEAQLELLKPYKLPLVAEKVETPAEFNLYQDMGFDYFQGFFFAKPNVLSVKSIPASKLAVMELMATISNPDVSIQELGDIITRDASLSVKTLRYVNSPATGLSTEVTSIAQALTLLGLAVIRKWVMVLTLMGMDLEGKSPELFVIMLTRARLCELMAKQAKLDNPSGYFTIGLLSAIDVLLDAPMDALIEPLPLTAEMKGAITSFDGEAGAVLKTAIALEQGMSDELCFSALSEHDLNHLYLDALGWADEVNNDI